MESSIGKIPKSYQAAAPREPLGSRRKVVAAIRDLGSEIDAASTRDEIARVGQKRLWLEGIVKHYEKDIEISRNHELVERLRRVEELLSRQQAGDPIVRVRRDDPIGGDAHETSH